MVAGWGLAVVLMTLGLAWSARVKRIRVAVRQVLAIDSDREGNFRRIEYALARAEAEHADIAVFPESSILGWEDTEAHQLAEPIPGEDSSRKAELARRHKVSIPALSSAVYIKLDKREILAKGDPRRSFLSFSLEIEGKSVSRNILFFDTTRNLALPAAPRPESTLRKSVVVTCTQFRRIV